MVARNRSENNTVDQFETLLGISQWKLFLFPDLIDGLLYTKVATSRANLQIKKISKDEQSRIERACLELRELGPDENVFKADLLTGGGLISLHVNVNEEIAKRSKVTIEKINLHQSTSDICFTAFQYVYHMCARNLADGLKEFKKVLADKKTKGAKTKTTIQTCLRDGYLDTFANLMQRYFEISDFHHGQFESLVKDLTQASLGGTVTGDGFGAPAEYQKAVVKHFSSISGIAFSTDSQRASNFCFSQTDKIMGDRLTHLAEDILQMATELRLLFSGPDHGYGLVEFPKLLQGSSFFADKNNPLVAETVMSACMRAIALVGVQTVARAQRDFYLDVFKGVRFVSNYEAIVLLSHAIQTFAVLGISPLEFKKGTQG